MSRTYRRKHYHLTQNTSWDRRGKKVALQYTKRVGYYNPTYRKMTEREIVEYEIRTHRDNKRGSYTPPSWFNRLYERKFRRMNKRELHKYMRNEEYEPMCMSNPPDTKWDWW